MGQLKGKVALVTGASGGIGRQIAVRLAENGAKIIAHYSSREEQARETAAAVQAAGGDALLVRADLSGSEGVARLFAAIDETVGASVDILVNNAGLGTVGAISDVEEADIDAMFKINFKSPILVTKQALARMPNDGVIVNVTSMSGLMAQPSGVVYAMCKAALNSFTRSLAADLASRGIRVNAVAPGPVDTDLINAYRSSAEAMRALEGLAALGRLGRPDDIAQIVLFLASPGAGWLTGQVLQATGGMAL